MYIYVIDMLIHTYPDIPMPFPCHATTCPLWKRPLKATAQRGMRAAWERQGMGELASAVQRRRMGNVPRSTFSGYHAEFHDGCYQKQTNSSDISVYHADFHEGHGTVRDWQGRGMACVN
jgi:hypothetical protein